jgi:hypothetical protein
MSPKLFIILYLVIGVLVTGAAVYNLVISPQNYMKWGLDAILAVYVFFRAYRIYKTKQDSELM